VTAAAVKMMMMTMTIHVLLLHHPPPVHNQLISQPSAFSLSLVEFSQLSSLLPNFVDAASVFCISYMSTAAVGYPGAC